MHQVSTSTDVLRQALSSVRTVLFDGDGVLWRGETEIPGAMQTISELRADGKRVMVCLKPVRVSCWSLSQCPLILLAHAQVVTNNSALTRRAVRNISHYKANIGYHIGGASFNITRPALFNTLRQALICIHVYSEGRDCVCWR